MRLLVLFLLIITNCAVACAQATTSGRFSGSPSNLDYIAQQLQAGKGARTIPNIGGTPLLFPYWTKGNVLTINGPVKLVWLKYNLANNELLWRRQSGDSLSLNTIQIKEFNLGDSLRGEVVTFRRYQEGIMFPIPFFEVLYDSGKYALLRHRTKTAANFTSSSPSLTESRPPSWQTITQYFIKKPNAMLVLIRLNEKSILEALGATQNPAVMAYLKREHLSLKKEDDVRKFLIYYDTI